MTNRIVFVFLASSAVLRVSSTSENVSFVPPERNSSEIARNEETTEIPNTTSLPILSRKRRYVVFPKGSSIQSGDCETVQGYTPLTTKFKVGITLALAWMLPYEAHELYLQKRDVDEVSIATAAAGFGTKHRADLYRVLEALLTMKGLKGRDCIMRAVCEAFQIKQNERNSTSGELCQGTFMEELFKLLFTLPFHHKHKTPYDAARKNAGKCEERYTSCNSFLDLAI